MLNGYMLDNIRISYMGTGTDSSSIRIHKNDLIMPCFPNNYILPRLKEIFVNKFSEKPPLSANVENIISTDTACNSKYHITLNQTDLMKFTL